MRPTSALPFLLLLLRLFGRANADGCSSSGPDGGAQCCLVRDDACSAVGLRQFDYDDDGDLCYCDQACLENYDCCADYNRTCRDVMIPTTTTTRLPTESTATTTTTALPTVSTVTTKTTTSCVDIWTNWCPQQVRAVDCLQEQYAFYCCMTCRRFLTTTTRMATTRTIATTTKMATIASTTCPDGDIWGSWCTTSADERACTIDRVREFCCVTCNANIMISATTTTRTTTTRTTTTQRPLPASPCSGGDVWTDWCRSYATKERCEEKHIKDNCCFTCSRYI